MPKGDKNTGTEAREPVEARGNELMALIAASEGGKMYLTQSEGLDLVNSGYAVVDTNDVQGDTAAVRLTDAGTAALTSDGSGGGGASAFEIEDGVEMPTSGARRGRTSTYPFEMLEVNQSFHVPVKGDEKPEQVAARLQSSVSGARARFSEETGETETVMQKVYAKDDNGEFRKDEAGKRIVESETPIERPKKTLTRDFKVLPVQDDPKGPGARVWRTR